MHKLIFCLLLIFLGHSEKLLAQACNTPWVSGNTYVAGNAVSYNGRNFTAKWWTQAIPDPTNQWGDWADNGVCSSCGAVNAGSIGSAQSILTNTAPNPLTSISAASGGNGSTYTYQWQSSTNNSTWTDISGANATTYAPGALTVNTYFRRKASSGACGEAYTSSVLMKIVPLMDSDNDGVPDHIDLDNDNDGILDVAECPAGNFQWSTPPNVVSTYKATGTIHGVINYSYTSDQPVQTETVFQGVGSFPAQYNLVEQKNVMNTQVSSNTLVFDQPVTDPILAFGSIGAAGNPVGITFSDPIEILWSENVTQNSSTQMTGSEGHAVIKLKGVFTTFSFNYLVSEYRVNFAFGSDFTNDCDIDNDGIDNALDIDSDGDGCVDAIEGGAAFTSANLTNNALSGVVDSKGVPVIAGASGQTAGTSQKANEKDAICVNTNTESIEEDTVTICYGDTATINANNITSEVWSGTDVFQKINASTIKVSPLNNAVYYISNTTGSYTRGTNIIVNGSFNAGNTGFTSDYTYQTVSVYNAGDYAINTNGQTVHSGFAACTDHTTGTGQMMIVNGTSVVNSKVWCQNIPIIANTDYEFSAWINTLVESSPAVMEFDIDGSLLGTTLNASNSNCQWLNYAATWKSGNITSAKICLVNKNTSGGGNDFAIDDIEFVPIQYTSTNSKDSVVVLVNPNPTVNLGADKEICSGATVPIDAANIGATYKWCTGATTQTISVNTINTYTVTVTSKSGCTSSDAIAISKGSCTDTDKDGYEDMDDLDDDNDGILDVVECTDNTASWDFETPVVGAGNNNQGSTFQGWTCTGGGWINLIHPPYGSINPNTAASGNQYVEVAGTGDFSRTYTVTTPGLVTVEIDFASWDAGTEQTQINIFKSDGTTLVAQSPIITSIPPANWSNAWQHRGSVSANLPAGDYIIKFFLGNYQAFDNVRISSASVATCDLDNDGIINSLDLDSDGDGCVDAIEGAGSFKSANLTNNALSGAVDAKGIPVIAGASGQGVGSSENAAIKDADCSCTPPVVDLGADKAICADASLTLDAANAGSTYKWSTTATTQTISVNTSNTYTVTVTNASNCSASDAIVVTVNNLPTPSINGVSICKGANTTLSAIGGTTYTWDDATTNATKTVAPTTTTTYSVTATTNGCTAKDTAVVTVKALPTPSISGISICNGTNTTLSATGGTAYTWDDATTNASRIVSPTTITTYSVTATTNGCTAKDTAVVTVNPLPKPGLIDQTICEGASVTLTALEGTTYAWSTSATTKSITVTPITATSYFVTVTQNGCSAIDTAYVQVLTTPATVFGDTICEKETAIVNAGGGADAYLWSNGASTSSMSVSPAISTTYSVTITLNNGCTASGTSSVVVNSLPVASTNFTDSTLCPGNSIKIIASGGTTYEWSNGNKTSMQIITPTASTTYTITAISSNGCKDTATVTVKLHANAVPSAGSSVSICNGNSTTLTASGGGTYLWSDGATTASNTVSPTSTITYSVTVTAITGCSGTDSLIVTVDNIPTAAINGDTSICFGNSASLTASGGNTYAWSNVQTTASISVSPVAATNYTVTVYSLAGCTDTEELEVNVNVLPTVSAGADLKVCKELSIPLSATKNDNWLYSWSAQSGGVLSSAAIRQPDASLNDPTSISADTYITYTVTVTDLNGCTDSDEVAVLFEFICQPRVTLVLDNDQLCLGESTNLSANATWTGSLNYTWSNAFSGVGPHVVNPTTTTTYYITVTDTNDPTKSDSTSIVLTINPLPVADAGLDDTVCLNQSTSLTANGASAYLWNNGKVTASIAVSPTNQTIYSVIATDVNGCSDADSVIVFVNSLPTVVIGNDSTICPGTNMVVTASGGNAYLWNNGATTDVLDVSPSANTKYTVTVTDLNNCSNTGEILISLHPAVTANAGNDVGVCIGNAISLTASGGSTYLWSTTETSAMINIAPLITTTYSLTATSVHGCSDTDEVSVTINNLPTANIGSDFSICIGDDTTLTETNTGVTYLWSNGATSQSVQLTINANAAYTVTITDNNTCSDSASIQISTLGKPTIAFNAIGDVCVSATSHDINKATPYDAGGTYWGNYVSGTSFNPSSAGVGTHTINYTYVDGNGCSDTAQQDVEVLALPTITMADVNICIGQSTTLSAGPASRSYVWDNGDTLNEKIVTPDTTTKYAVTTSIAGGCSASDEVVVYVNPLPVVDIAAGTTSGCSPLQVQFTNTSIPTASTYTWNYGDNSTSSALDASAHSHIYHKEGMYTLTVTATTALGCSTSQVFANFIQVYPQPKADFTYTPEYPSVLDPEVTFIDLSEGTIMGRNWQITEADSNVFQTKVASPLYKFNLPGEYPVKLIVTSNNNCVDTVLKTVVVSADHTFYLPNAFTPNQDGINDVFGPIGIGVDEQDFVLYIYSRWGELIFSSDNLKNAWDGSIFNSGEQVPDGCYTWLCSFKDLAGTKYQKTGVLFLMH